MTILTNPAHLGPPHMEEILGLVPPVADELDRQDPLLGIEGTWHRLWGTLILHCSFLGPLPKLVGELRDEFEEHLGRRMSQAEWAELSKRARTLAESL